MISEIITPAFDLKEQIEFTKGPQSDPAASGSYFPTRSRIPYISARLITLFTLKLLKRYVLAHTHMIPNRVW